MSRTLRATTRQVILYILLVIVLLWILVPIVWMLLSSLKPTNAIFSSTPTFLFVPTLQHYIDVFTSGNGFSSYIVNSILASGISTLISVGLGCFAGYGLARAQFKGKDNLAFWIISTRMAPIAAVILPLYIGFRYLHLTNTLTGLIISYLTFNLPFAIWIMNAFFSDLPISLEEAARVDGAGRWQTFWDIVLPLVAPGTATTAILCLVFAWNDYSFAQTFAGPNSQTLPLSASQLITQTGIDWGQLTAIGTIVALPMVVIGLAVRRWLVKGLTLGAVK
ncbi:MAG TPA: carbohydrate ABC transporter permease [Ktedonobacteraceae bacterium]|jgi:multiple sugar transport system permease protein|nr:carbohydrate ABC transporter permease [Ktedonobacteraceae bacterium]